MIRLTRLNSQQITVNSDLIKFVESNPDTVITLVSGEKILVHETADEVLARVIEFRRAVLNGLLFNSVDPSAALTTVQRMQADPSIPRHAEGTSRG